MNDKDNRTDRNKENIPAVPPGMWIKCTKCGKLIYRKELEKNKFICMKCGKYFRMPSENRILDIIDEGSFVELFTDVLDKNPIDFPGYSEKKEIIKKETNLKEAVITGKASIGHIEVMLGVCDTRYLMGSMGYIVGEKITKLFENATKAQLPVIMINCSGGARMQEGIISLMQMAKTVDSVKQHSDAGLLYISVLTDPTTGGVAASFAMLGDVILAEPNSLIGFAGPRVIEQTTKQKLDNKTRELAYIAVLAATGIMGGLLYHVQSAKKLGASRDEVKSAILVGLPAVGLTIIDPLEAALKAFDGKSDQIL